MEKVKDLISEVLETIEAGHFTSKAAQKRVLETLSQAYERVLDRHLDQNRGGGYFWDVPPELHHATPKRLDTLRTFKGIQGFEEFEEWVTQLRDLREAVKAVPVAKQAPKNQKVAEVYQQAIDRLKQHDELVELGDLFNGIPVSATPHSVYRNGKCFLRVFFYVNNKLTPLNTIIAAAQTRARQEEA